MTFNVEARLSIMAMKNCFSGFIAIFLVAIGLVQAQTLVFAQNSGVEDQNDLTPELTFCPSTNRHYFGDVKLCPEHQTSSSTKGRPLPSQANNDQLANFRQTTEGERKIVELEQERNRLLEEIRRLDSEKTQREQAKQASRLSLQASASKPDATGDFVINIQTSADTASL